MKHERGMLVGTAALVVTLGACWLVLQAPETAVVSTIARAPANADQAPPAATVTEREVVAPARVESGWYHAPVGTRMTYEFRLALTSDLRLRSVAPAQDRYDLTGHCVVTLVHREGERIVTRLVLDDAKLSVGGGGGDEAAIADAVADLAAGAWVDMRADGAVSGIAFADGVDPSSFNWLRTVVDALQVQAREGVASWQIDEVGGNGEAQVTYHWEPMDGGGRPMRLAKHRARSAILTASGAPGALPAADTAQWQGQSRAVFDGEVGWLASVALQENCTGSVQDTGFQIDLGLEVQLTCVGHERLTDFDHTVPATWESLDGTATSRERAARKTSVALDLELAGRSPADLVADLAAAIAAGDEATRSGYFDLLVRVMRDRPEWVAEIADRIGRADAEASVLEALAIALAAAGTQAAQQALANWLGDDGMVPAVRSAAVRAVFALQQPLPEILARVAALAQSAGDADLQDTSVLALGCATGRVASECTQLFAAQLHDLLRVAEQRGNLRLWFEAVGNSGLQEAIDWCERFAGAAEDVQADRLIALRRVQDPRALAILVEAAAAPSARVRLRALDVLADRPDQARATLLAAAANEPDGDALRAALRGVAALAVDAEVRATLQRLQQEHGDAEIRALAAALLARS